MKQIIILCSLGVIAGKIWAQKETVDIISFAPPKGWTKSVKATVTSFNYTDKKDGSWCLIGVYKSTASKGSIEADFESEWNELVAKTYNITDTPDTSATQEADGWKIKVGTGKFTYNKKPAASMLTTFSGYGKCVSIVSTTANERYLQDIQDLIASVELSKPDTNNISSNEKQTPSSLNQKGFAFSTTTFNDGWTSAIQNDWVLVTKDDIKVYLWYGLSYNASSFSGTGLIERDYYWDNYVSKYFTIQTKQYRDNGEIIGSLKPNYVEGWAVDKQTGKKRFIGMKLDIAPNTAYLTIASAKDEATLWQQFPKANGSAFSQSDLSNMSGYNKFAIGPYDLTGTWEDGGGSTMNWYSTTTGENVGATGAVTSDVFRFIDARNYTSTHNGATGVIGAMNTFQQNYKGTYTVTDWTITATNRFEGKTQVFNAWFEVVRGGRVLHLQDAKYTGYHIKLVKTK
jgi:hypothetical protein